MSTPVVIQAGGKGTRLYPYTQVLPKPLMPIGGTPILKMVIGQLADHGFRDLHITLGYLGEMIRWCCGTGRDWGVRIRYWEEDQPLGTIGPLRKIEGLDRPFLVLNGDLLTDLSFSNFFEFHRGSGAELSIATYMKAVQISLGVLDIGVEQRVIGFREKPAYEFPCSMGIYGIHPSVLSLIPNDEYFGFDDLMRRVLEQQRDVRSYPFAGTWLDIGRPEDLAAACELFDKNPNLFTQETRRKAA